MEQIHTALGSLSMDTVFCFSFTVTCTVVELRFPNASIEYLHCMYLCVCLCLLSYLLSQTHGMIIMIAIK